MPEVYSNGPSLSDIARRLQRVEDKLDERIATVDMLRSTEKLFEAREIAHTVTTKSLEDRVKSLEDRSAKLTQMIIAAGLALLVQAVILVITLLSGGGAHP